MLNYVAQILIAVATFAVLAGSLNLVLGYAGVFSLVHAAFFGIGAYTTGQLVLLLGVPFPLDMIASFLTPAIIAGVLSLPLARLTHEYVIVGTLAMQLVLSNVFLNWQAVTGASYGLFGIPRPWIAGFQLTSLPSYAAFAIGIATLCFAGLWWVVQSPFGLALKGLREDDRLAQSFGKDVNRQRVVAFAVGSGIAGVAGMLYARFVGYIDPSTFAIDQSLAAVTILVVGGLANLWGTLLSALILEAVPQVLRFVPATSNAVPQLQLLFYGVLLTALVRLRPQGLIAERPLLRSPLPSVAGEGWGEGTPASQAAPAPATGPTLQIRDLAKRFGGLRAVDGLSLTIPPGQVTGIIGPNGAGKTTVFNMITGYLRPDSGGITYNGHDLTGLQPFQIARLGISRSFQDLRVFARMTVLENVVLAIQSRDSERLLGPRRLQTQAKQRALAVLLRFGLGDRADDRVSQLSYAQQKLLVVATLVARNDPFILLDELAAGLDQESVHLFAGLVRQMAAGGHTVCLIEHNLDFVWQAADTVFVLDQGKLLAQGTPEEIQRDARVAEIYFGGTQTMASAGS
ncbi:MAG TPA: branched-chain amino acid ABC transporter ATP-binding protein/permease [Chloroflexota bacterium]|nr:branched-chain amino acid ABC transporter ATP-binding protein/permease [Chloroflexota bacterium]